MKILAHFPVFRKAYFFKASLCLNILFVFSLSAYALGVCTSAKLKGGLLIPVGGSPRQVIAGDLNNDGAADMVVISGGSYNSGGSASVLLNNKNGNFTVVNNFSFNFAVTGAVLADFNQDGTLDLAVTGPSSNGNSASSLVIYYNNGNGLFNSQNAYTFSGSANAIATGDFNSDGAVDIVLANSGSGNFGSATVFLNDGFGGFNYAGDFSVGGLPRAIGVADFNGDGAQDIVTINTNGTGSLIFGNGAGSFQLASNFTISTNSYSFSQPSLAIGDLNNDGRPDLAVVSPDSNSLYTLLNNNGNFPNAVATIFQNTNFAARAVAIGQVTGDNNLDIVIAGGPNYSSSGTNAVAVLAGNGSGTFGTINPQFFPVGVSPSSVVIADFDRDGRNDLATADTASNDVAILLNNGADKFGPNSFPTVPNPGTIAVADFNGDGNLDTAVETIQNSYSQPSGNTITISFGDGAGGVSGSQTFGAGGATTALIAADVNNDSRPDLIASITSPVTNTASAVAVYLNSGNNSAVFSSPPSSLIYIGFTVRAIVVGDFNQDGKIDLIITSSNSNAIALLLGTGNGNFAAPAIFAAPVSNAAVATGDFNKDGKLDLVLAGTTANGSGAIYTLLGNGDGTFTALSSVVAANNPTSIAVGDFNGDSILDIAATISANNYGNSSNSYVIVALGIGGGRFGQSNAYAVGNDARSVVAADFNGDRKPDLIVANRASNSVSVLTNNGNGNFSQAANFLAGISPEQLAVGDFNHDGRTDAVTANSGGNNFSLITNSCQEAVTKTDYDGDGRTDFALFNPSTGIWSVLSSNLKDTKIQIFGKSGDIPAPGDFDGDGASDIAVFRPSNGTWYILRSTTGTMVAISFGASGDIPVAADYTGDGRTDIAVYRPSNGVWYIRQAVPTQTKFTAFQFGNSSDRPVPADYDGDGKADIAVYRDGLWIILRSSDSAVTYQQFGIASDTPVAGDYDGDGKADIAVYRSGIWYILTSSNNSFRAESFGAATDIPQPGDYDGDGRTDIAVYRPSETTWYVLRSSDRQFTGAHWGTSGDVPVSSLYSY